MVSQAPGRVRDPLPAPPFERAHQGVLDDLLGEVEIAEEPHQATGEPAGLLPEDGRDRGIGRAGQDGAAIGLTSTAPIGGQLLAIARASSRSATSTSA